MNEQALDTNETDEDKPIDSEGEQDAPMEKSGIQARVHHEMLEEINPEAIDGLLSMRAAEISGPHGSLFSADAGIGYGGVGMTRETRKLFANAVQISMTTLYPDIPESPEKLAAQKVEIAERGTNQD